MCRLAYVEGSEIMSFVAQRESQREDGKEDTHIAITAPTGAELVYVAETTKEDAQADQVGERANATHTDRHKGPITHTCLSLSLVRLAR